MATNGLPSVDTDHQTIAPGAEPVSRAPISPPKRTSLITAVVLCGVLLVALFVDAGREPATLVAWAGVSVAGLVAPRARRRDVGSACSNAAGVDLRRVDNHDMASALLAIEGAVAALRIDQNQSPTAQEHAERLDAIADAIENEIGRIRRITTANPAPERSCHARQVIDRLVALQRARGVIVDVVLEGDPHLAMSPDDLARALLNLFDNCARYAPNAPITISGVRAGADYELLVADEGPGMCPDVLDRAFDRGVSSRRDGGLGLFSVRELVRSAGGTTAMQSSEHGTTITLRVPATENPGRRWTDRAPNAVSDLEARGCPGSATTEPSHTPDRSVTTGAMHAPAPSTTTTTSAPRTPSTRKEFAA